MALHSELVTLLRELMESYDSSIDTSDNSDFYNRVLNPFLTRVGGDILTTDTESFLADFVSEQHPTLDTSQYSGIRDLILRPISTMLEPIKREVNDIRLKQSFVNADSMTNDELNQLLANFFLEKVTGGYATGTVRVYFNDPVDVNTAGAVFFTADGKEYVPVSNVIYSASQMSFNVSGTQFYIDIIATASGVGENYNISTGTITSVEGIPSAVSAQNITAMTGGSNAESNSEAVTRARNSITTQNLVTKNGIDLVLKTNFSGVEDVTSIGFGEPDMVRDLVDGPATVSKVPGGSYTQTTADVPDGGIHIGGKTDVYVYDGTSTGQVSKSLSLSNLTDVGIPILSGQTGYVLATSAPQTFYDKTGYFDTRGVVIGDVLYVDDASHSITAVGSNTLTLATAIPSIQSSIKYEVRRPSKDGSIRIPLHNLSALDSDGLVAISHSSSTTPSQPIPGDKSLLPLQDGLGNVAKTENVVQIVDASSAGNAILPIFNVSSIQLGAGSGAYSDLGRIALAEVLEVTAPSGFVGGDDASGIALGKLRVYCRDKTNILAIPTIQDTTDGASSGYNSLSVETNGTFTDQKTGQKYTGPIYKSSIYKYGIAPPKATTGTNPFVWGHGYSGVIGADPSDDDGSTGIANGNYLYIDRSVSYTDKPVAGMWVHNTGHANNRKYQLIQILSVEEVEGTKADGYTSGTLYYECRVRAEDDTIPEYTTAGADTFYLYQGVLAENLQYDSTFNIYYAEFDAFCLNSNDTDSNISANSEITLERHANGYNASQPADYQPFRDGLSGDNEDFYLEGYKLRSIVRGYAFSTKEEPYLILTNFLTLIDSNNNASSSAKDLSDLSLSFAMKLSYINASTVSSIQTFVDLDENRIVGEDILVKPYLPAIPFGALVGGGVEELAGDALLKTFVESLESEKTLELSDLINYLYQNAVTYIELPLSLYVIRYSQERKISGERVLSKSTLSNLERFFTATTMGGVQSINFNLEV